MLLSQKVANSLRQFFPSHTGGRTFYVDNSGVSKADLDVTPFQTLQSAINACVANRGDLIIVKRTHAESMSTTATTPVFNKAGVTIRGEGRGSNRPTFTFTGTTDTLTLAVSAADVTIENLRFLCGNDGLDNMVTVTGVACTFRGCMFTVTPMDGTIQWDTCITSSAANLVIENCRFEGDFGDGATDCIELDGGRGAQIIDNFIAGDFSVSAISAVNTAIQFLEIIGNRIYNDDATAADRGIDLVAGCTGILARNLIYVVDVAPGTNGIDQASCACLENYITGDVAAGGALFPAADTL